MRNKRSDGGVTQRSWILALSISGFAAGISAGTPPVINASWEEFGSPQLGADYVVNTDPPASLDFPDVELRTGSLTWRIWSTDPDNPDGIGDIGVISSPAAQNFGVRIAAPSPPGYGARNVKGIVLDPTSGSNYSRITGGVITGDLQGDLFIQDDDAPTENSTLASFTITGTTTGAITVPKIPSGAEVSIGPMTGTVQFGTVQGDLAVGTVSGSFNITKIASVDQNILVVNIGDVTATGVVSIGDVEILNGGWGTSVDVGALAGSLHVTSLRGAMNVNGPISGEVVIDEIRDTGGQPGLDVIENITSTGSLIVRDMIGNTSVEVECNATGLPFDGTITLEGGIKDGQSVIITCNNGSIGTLDLNNQGVAAPMGSLDFHVGGLSTVCNGGVVGGTVEIGSGENQTVFAGTATFTRVERGGYLVTDNCADLAGTIYISEFTAGRIAVSGSMRPGSAIWVDGDVRGTDYPWGIEVGGCGPGYSANGDIIANADGVDTGEMTGRVIINGPFSGNLCADNLSATDHLPVNIVIPEFGPNAKVCGQVVCGGPLAGVSGDLSKNRAVSFSVPPSIPAANAETAIHVTMVDLQHPNPPSLPAQPPPNFTTYDTRLNGVCVGGNHTGHHCDAPLVNDGCPAAGTCHLTLSPCTIDLDCIDTGPCDVAAESGAQCLNNTNDDSDDEKVNDGCPMAGAAPESGGQCGNNTDDDPADDSGCPSSTCGSLAACTADPACTDPLKCTPPSNSCARWVGKPGTFLENRDVGPSGGTYRAARLQCTPFYHDWSTEDVFHVVGAEILPSSTYELQAVPVVGSVCSAPLPIQTARWGDVTAPFQAPSPEALSQPNALDVAAVINKLKNLPGALSKVIVQLQPNLPELNANVNALDILVVVDAVKGLAYPFSGPCPCPSLSTCAATACTGTTVCVGLPAESGGGAGAQCVKTCIGGTNDGNPCINSSHCPGGSCGVPKCLGGMYNGNQCTTTSQCLSAGGGACNYGFCRDRCGRCTPP